MIEQVFLIQAHKDSNLLKKIVSRLDAPNHYFVIHVDRKSCVMYEEIKQEFCSHDNIIVMEANNVMWGGAGQFFTTLKQIELSIEKWPFLDFFHLISGQDYPVKSIHEFDNFFNTNRNYNYLAINDMPQAYYRSDIYHFCDIIDYRTNNIAVKGIIKLMSSIQRKIIDSGIRLREKIPLQIYKGPNWWSLNREAINHILSYIKENPSYKRRFKYTYCCDEVFFHTILYNSELKNSIVNDSLRYTDWTKNGRGEPNILDETDFEKIIQSNSFFCRKIESERSKRLIFDLDNKQK